VKEILISQKTGFRTSLPFVILDARKQLFYSDEFTNEISNGKVLFFNLPKGKYYFDGYFIKLEKPVNQPQIILPKPERNLDKGKLYKITFGKNPNKASIFHDKKLILFDESFKTAPLFVVYDIYFHELGHLYYETEEFADLFATKALLDLGFNKSQIGLSPVLSLSEKNDYRKILKANSLKQ
jgi:hypothetical protein